MAAERTVGPESPIEALITPGVGRASIRARGSIVVAQHHNRRDSQVRHRLALADGLAVTLGLGALLVSQGHFHHPGRLLLGGLATIPVWIVIFKAYGLYDRDVRRINHSTIDDLPWIFHALLLGCVLLWLYYRAVPVPGVHFGALGSFGLVTAVAMVVLRVAARRVALSQMGGERVLLLGDGQEIELLARKLLAHPEYGADPIGFVSLSDRGSRRTSLPLLGDLREMRLPQLVRQHDVERVVVVHRELEPEAMVDVLRDCRELGVKVSVLPQLYDAMGSSVELDDVEGLTLLGVHPPVLARSSRFLKRSMDIAGAMVLLIVTAPLQLAIALAIKLGDGGPVFFRQRRIGQHDCRIEVMKFRTMCVDAESQRDALLEHSTDPGWLLLDHDPRVTKVGRFLRLTSLDELPQAWNVLRGEMSLVGPRPLVEDEGGRLDGWRRSRIDLKPGLTGLWQVLGRTSIPFDEMIKLDYLYVTNWSLWNDVRLLLRTLPAVFERRGAN